MPKSDAKAMGQNAIRLFFFITNKSLIHYSLYASYFLSRGLGEKKLKRNERGRRKVETEFLLAAGEAYI